MFRLIMPQVAYLDWLESSLAESLETANIGELAVIRAYLALDEDHGRLTAVSGATVALAGRLLGRTLDALHAEGGVEQGQISVQASFGGLLAMISVEALQPGKSPEARLFLLGEKGSLNHEDSPGSDGIRVDLAPPASPSETAQVERSLQTGGPVEA